MGYGAWGGSNIGAISALSFSGKSGLSSRSRNSNEPKKPEKKHIKVFRIILKYSFYLYFVFCAFYTVYKFIYREIDLYGKIENKYSVPLVHKVGNITYDNYISINGHEIKANNAIFYKYNIGEYVAIKYTTNVIDIHQIVGLLVLIFAFPFLIVGAIFFLWVVFSITAKL